jgi:hypothetical protein
MLGAAGGHHQYLLVMATAHTRATAAASVTHLAGSCAINGRATPAYQGNRGERLARSIAFTGRTFDRLIGLGKSAARFKGRCTIKAHIFV